MDWRRPENEINALVSEENGYPSLSYLVLKVDTLMPFLALWILDIIVQKNEGNDELDFNVGEKSARASRLSITPSQHIFASTDVVMLGTGLLILVTLLEKSVSVKVGRIFVEVGIAVDCKGWKL